MNFISIRFSQIDDHLVHRSISWGKCILNHNVCIQVEGCLDLTVICFENAQMVKNLPEMWDIWVQSSGWEDPLEKRMATYSSIRRASLVAQMVKNLSTMWETWVWSLGGEDPLKKGMATHASILAWRTPRTEEPGGLPSMVLQSWAGLSD